jgi:hypothetical protein
MGGVNVDNIFIISWSDVFLTKFENLKNCFRVQRNINSKYAAPFPSHNDAIYCSNCINFASFFGSETAVNGKGGVASREGGVATREGGVASREGGVASREEGGASREEAIAGGDSTAEEAESNNSSYTSFTLVGNFFILAYVH